MRETKKQVKVEIETEKLRRIIPNGLPNLAGKYEKALTGVWDERVLETNLTLNHELKDLLTDDEALNMAFSDEVNTMFENRHLNTETLQQILHPKGYLTSEGAKYFCKLLEENFPESRFIYLNQALSHSEARILHANEINVRGCKNINFIFNRSPTQVFDTENLAGHHYAAASINESGEVLLVDSIYKQVPMNLKSVLDDYYRVRFGKQMPEITNLSQKKNSPVQRDSFLCGFISLMILTLFENESCTELFKYTKNRIKPDDGIFIVFTPSTYGQYMRRIFLQAYSEHRISVDMFLSAECLTKLSTKVDAIKNFDKKLARKNSVKKSKNVSSESQDKLPHGMTSTKKFSARNSKSNMVFSSSTKGSTTTKNRSNNKMSTNEESIVITDCFSDLEEDKKSPPTRIPSPVTTPPSSTKKTSSFSPSTRKTSASLITKKKSASSSPTRKTSAASQSTKKTSTPTPSCRKTSTRNTNSEDDNRADEVPTKPNIMPSNFIGRLAVSANRITSIDGTFAKVGDIHFDGYNWEQKKSHKARNKKVRYQCKGIVNGIRCFAEKLVSIPFGSYRKKQKLIEYISKHSCTPSSSNGPSTYIRAMNMNKVKLMTHLFLNRILPHPSLALFKLGVAQISWILFI